MAEPKPNFALDLSNEGITLWRRASGGSWVLIEQLPLNADDLPARIREMRKAAGIPPQSRAKTAVRIPRSEVLFSRLKLGVFEGEAANKQARKLIEEMTPYSLAEIQYDLDAKGAGNMAPVAVVARTTLLEAEQFANDHGFEVLYFTTISAPPDYPREPRFYLKPPKKPLLPLISKLAAVAAVGLTVGYFGYSYYRPAKAPTFPPVEVVQKADTVPAKPEPPKEPAPVVAKAPVPVPPSDQEPDFSAPQTATLIAPETTSYTSISHGDVGRTSLLRLKRLVPPLYTRGEIAPPTPNNPPQHKTDALALADALRDLPEVGINDDTLTRQETDMALPDVAPGTNGTPLELASFVPPQIDFTKVYSSTLPPPVQNFQIPPQEAAANPPPPPPPPAYMTAAPGTIEPTPEGAPGPENILIYAGQPSRLPPARPVIVPPADPLAAFKPRSRPDGLVSAETLAALIPTDGVAPETPVQPDAADQTIVAPPETGQSLALSTAPAALTAPVLSDSIVTAPENSPQPLTILDRADPTLAGLKPRLRPEALNTQEPPTEPQGLLALADPALAGKKPRLRPEALNTQVPPAEPQGLLALADPALAGKKPRGRPAGLNANSQPEPTGLLALANPALAKFRAKKRPATLEVIAQDLQRQANRKPEDIQATPLAVAYSPMPKIRPADLGPGLAISNNGSTRGTAKTPKSAVGSSRPSPSPTVASVTKAATIHTRINKRKINLIGVFGTPNARRALVRMPSGRYVKVKRGDKISGWQVSAIGESSLRIRKGSRNEVLRIP